MRPMKKLSRIFSQGILTISFKPNERYDEKTFLNYPSVPTEYLNHSHAVLINRIYQNLLLKLRIIPHLRRFYEIQKKYTVIIPCRRHAVQLSLRKRRRIKQYYGNR